MPPKAPSLPTITDEEKVVATALRPFVTEDFIDYDLTKGIQTAKIKDHGDVIFAFWEA